VSDARGGELCDLEVVALDCQTTGASPAHGHLLEVAWATGRGTADAPIAVESTFVALPDGSRVPPRIARLTGIDPDQLEAAPSAGDVWERVRATTAAAPAVLAHYARFERAFLEDLHAAHDTEPFPFAFLCTHEIARRLLPGLPRRGLRAVAGRLGHVMEEEKRAAGHARATLLVWRGLVERLRDIGVTTLDEVRQWMETTAPATRGGREYAMPRERRLALPDSPGVYRMLGPGGETLYVGKATSLRRRVNGYFQKRRTDRALMPEMLTQTYDVDVTETGSPLEAALLEFDEIARRSPPYNTALRVRDSTVWFATPDLDSVRETPDDEHRFGPFARPESATALAALRTALATATPAPEEIGRALGLPGEAPLDADAATEGAELVRERWGTGIDPIRLGALIWRERRDAVPEEADDEQEAEDEEEERAGGFDPDLGVWIPGDADQVARALEHVALDGALRIRRGRWFAELVDARLRWRSTTDPDGAERTLRLEGGRVVAGDERGMGARRRSRIERLRALDATTLVRLRVLTTELRRLVAAEVPVELELGRRRLDRSRIAARLEWL